MLSYCKSTGILILLLLISSFSQGQTKKNGSIQIVGDMRVSMLVDKHIEMNQRLRTIPGFRIQVASLSGNDSKNRAFALCDKIQEAYPNTQIYVVFDEPVFKVKVGDFRTRLEAYAFLNKMKAVFPGTIIKDNVYALPLTLDETIPDEDF